MFFFCVGINNKSYNAHFVITELVFLVKDYFYVMFCRNIAVAPTNVFVRAGRTKWKTVDDLNVL